MEENKKIKWDQKEQTAGEPRQRRDPGRPRYFEEALSDFTHDVASGGAIRHLVDLGYSTDQIMKRLDFPTSRERVEKMVYRQMVSTGILLEELPTPEEALTKSVRSPGKPGEFCAWLREAIEEEGEENSYVSCPYGMWRRDREKRLAKAFACLTSREREYLMGIPWAMQMMYHRLNDRMAEISIQMALSSAAELSFYFLGSGRMVKLSSKPL